MYDDHDYGAQTERHLCTIVLFLYFMIELGRKPFCILPSILNIIFVLLNSQTNWKVPQAIQARQSNIQTELISWLYIFVHFRKRCIAQPCRLIRELSLCHITLSQLKQKCSQTRIGINIHISKPENGNMYFNQSKLFFLIVDCQCKKYGDP